MNWLNQLADWLEQKRQKVNEFQQQQLLDHINKFLNVYDPINDDPRFNTLKLKSVTDPMFLKSIKQLANRNGYSQWNQLLLILHAGKFDDDIKNLFKEMLKDKLSK